MLTLGTDKLDTMRVSILLITLLVQPVSAYLDTTSKDFAKPTKIETHPYVYQRPQYEKYIDVAAEKIAPRVFSNIVGAPASTLLNITDKVTEPRD